MRAILITLLAGLVFVAALLLLTGPDETVSRAGRDPVAPGTSTAQIPGATTGSGSGSERVPGMVHTDVESSAPLETADAFRAGQSAADPGTASAGRGAIDGRPRGAGDRSASPRFVARSEGLNEAQMRALLPPEAAQGPPPADRKLTPSEAWDRDVADAELAVAAGLDDEIVVEYRVDNLVPNGTPEEREQARTRVLAQIQRDHAAAVEKVGADAPFTHIQHVTGVRRMVESDAR